MGPLTTAALAVRLWVFRHDQKGPAVAVHHAGGRAGMADAVALPLLRAVGRLSDAQDS